MSKHEFFPDEMVRLGIDGWLTYQLLDAQDRVNQGPVTPIHFDRERFHAELAAYDFEQARPLDETMAWTIEQMVHGLVHITHPRYFGLFNPTPTFPAQCADRITAVFNPQLATGTTSPAAVAIEAHVIDAVAKRVGLPLESRGHFTTGGSEANYTAIILGLTRACPGYTEDGLFAFSGQPVFYVSRDCHLAWIKIACQAGLGRSAVRLVATDGTGRLDPFTLQAMLHQDRAQGRIPFLLAATAGTTNAGMIDPLEACADIARVWNLWFHVDAAWGGGLIASEKLRSCLSGIEDADSVTIDAHKWFATTMGCGIFITRHASLLSTAFHVLASFMPSDMVGEPYVTTVQWSRRFLGLRLFLSLAAAGWEGYARHVEHALAMVTHLKEQMSARGWLIANDSSAGVLCLVPPQGDATQIVKHVLASGQAWVSVAVFEGREVVRACVTSGITEKDDISALVTSLEQAAVTVSQGD